MDAQTRQADQTGSATTIQRVKVAYDPKSQIRPDFKESVKSFLDGSDTPRAYLERCLEIIEEREPTVRAFVTTNFAGARKAADASSERYKSGRPLSCVDGMPFAVKDSFETIDMPTQLASPVYKGWQSFRDAAHVWAMRRGGASIVGKTELTEFAIAGSPPTRNPYDTSRTAGGSSSGTAAAIGAHMLPVTSGTQARGSTIRPAGYCGAYALKPTFGAINQGGVHCMTMTHHHLTFFAATLRDMWETAFYVANTVGGDPGHPGLYGEASLPEPQKPDRVIRLYTRGWDTTDEAAKRCFDDFVGVLSKEVQIISRDENPKIAKLEEALSRIPEFLFPILGYEMRWPACHYRDDLGEHLLGEEVKRYLAPFENMTAEENRAALRKRDELRALFAEVRDIAPVCIAPAQPGIPPFPPNIGDASYGDVSSVLGAPAITLPLLAIDEMPFGIQLLGQQHEDYRVCAWGRWLADWYFARR